MDSIDFEREAQLAVWADRYAVTWQAPSTVAAAIATDHAEALAANGEH